MSLAAGPDSRRIPVLGQLGLVPRVAVLVTLALSFVAIVIDVGLHLEGAAVFVVAAAAILGLAWMVGLPPSGSAPSPARRSAASSTRPSATSPS